MYVDYVLLQILPTLYILTKIIRLHHFMIRFLRIMLDYAHMLADVDYAQYYARIMCASLLLEDHFQDVFQNIGPGDKTKNIPSFFAIKIMTFAAHHAFYEYY